MSRISREDALERLGNIRDDYILESFIPTDKANKADKAPGAFARFMNSGWGTAAACLVTAVVVYAALLMLGRGGFDKLIGHGAAGTTGTGTDDPVTVPMMEVQTEARTDVLTEAPTQADTEPQEEAGTTVSSQTQFIPLGERRARLTECMTNTYTQPDVGVSAYMTVTACNLPTSLTRTVERHTDHGNFRETVTNGDVPVCTVICCDGVLYADLLMGADAQRIRVNVSDAPDVMTLLADWTRLPDDTPEHMTFYAGEGMQPVTHDLINTADGSCTFTRMITNFSDCQPMMWAAGLRTEDPAAVGTPALRIIAGEQGILCYWTGYFPVYNDDHTDVTAEVMFEIHIDSSDPVIAPADADAYRKVSGSEMYRLLEETLRLQFPINE